MDIKSNEYMVDCVESAKSKDKKGLLKRYLTEKAFTYLDLYFILKHYLIS